MPENPTDVAALEARDIVKAFGRYPALKGVSLDVRPGEFLALLGPSGSGKTTLLRLIAGLETADSGTLTLDGADLARMSPRARRIGMVFQNYALFRHMTVAANIAFGLKALPRRERPDRREIDSRVQELLRLIHLEGYGDRYPAQLSGGQKQRVALARALAIQPRVLLLDEPFGALDAKVRADLRRWLRRIHDETGVTTLFVTHDQEEALDLADRVAILREGRIEQVGTSRALHAAPASSFVFDFLGVANRVAAVARAGAVHFGEAAIPLANPGVADGPVEAWFRPHEVEVSRQAPGLEAHIIGILPREGFLKLECRTAAGELLVVDASTGGDLASLQRGESIRIRPRRLFAWPAAQA